MDSEQAPGRTDDTGPDQAALDAVIESARRLGVAIDTAEAARWKRTGTTARPPGQADRHADHVRNRGPRRRSEAEMVRLLLAVRANLRARRSSAGRSAEVDEVNNEALRAVNDNFERRLTAIPEIKAYPDELAARAWHHRDCPTAGPAARRNPRKTGASI